VIDIEDVKSTGMAFFPFPVSRKACALIAKRLLLSYGGLALPLAFSGLPIYVYAPDLYTTLHHVPLRLMGIFLLCVRLVDAVQDPAIGVLSDRWSKWRFSIISGGLALLALSFVMLYNPPADGVSALIWFGVCMVGAALGFSTVSINYNALGSLWSDKPQEKTAIVAAREGIGLGGLLLATLTPPLLRLHFAETASYRIYAALFLAVAGVTLYIFHSWRSRSMGSFAARSLETGVAAFDFGLLFKRPFSSLFITYGLSTLASSIPGVLVVFFVRDYLHEQPLTGLFLAIYFLAGIVGMPLWKKLAVRIGKKQSWIVAMLMALVCFVGAYWLNPGDSLAYGIICFFSGLALGAELILPLSIASDMIDGAEQQARTSSVFAVLLFTSKLSLALASGGAFLLLSDKGYHPGTVSTAASLAALRSAYALVPSGIKLLAVGAALLLPQEKKPLAG
jgi:GPH family glycoside/pentoside/hexuronide:cation symporter